MNIDFPFHINGLGQTAPTSDADHIRDLIEQLLFTNPGERVNRPGFGSGLLQMVFAPNSNEIAAALQFTLQASLQQWLGDRIQLQAVLVNADGGTLEVSVQYANRNDEQTQTAQFSREI
jgi:uncharacterized protein